MSLFLGLTPLVVAAAASPAAPCTSIAGWEQVLADDQIRWVIVGEIHGTNETPDAFADVVCLTAQVRTPVVVAVEQPASAQTAIDNFIASDGGEAARRAFLEAPMWNGPMQDGRSSEAKFRLFETLRQMQSRGRIAAVVAFQPISFTGRPSAAEYEKAMAELVRLAAGPDATVIALVGNVHAMRTEVPWQGGYLPMAAHLPAKATVTLNVVGDGGESWSCTGQPVVCGVHATRPSGLPRARTVELNADVEAPYSGVLYLGITTTASPPAVANAGT